MTHEAKKSLFGVAAGSVATLIVGTASLLVITNAGGFAESKSVAQDTRNGSLPPVVGTTFTEKEDAFEAELSKSLESNFKATMSELESQAEVLERIEASIAGIASANTKRLSELDKERWKARQEPQVPIVIADKGEAPLPPGEKATEEKTTEEKAPEPVKQSPTRMSETVWNLMGTWDYTPEMLANHLKNDHDIDVEGYTREEMQIMHDNIHNGYDPMGSGLKYGGDSKTVRKTTQVRKSSDRGGLFRGLFQRSNCPGGT
jgi:hypothetical protein